MFVNDSFLDGLLQVVAFLVLNAVTLVFFFLVRRKIADIIVRNPVFLLLYLTHLPVKFIGVFMLMNYYKEKEEEREVVQRKQHKLYVADDLHE